RVWQLELPEEPVVVRGDATQLHQVLANLLSNARKHTGPGTTVVTGVKLTPDGSAKVTVTDNGPGIAPEFVDSVFARFTRADASRKNPAPVTTPAHGRPPFPHPPLRPPHQPSAAGAGAAAAAGVTGVSAEGTSGLGLSIVQSIVAAHGGTVGVASRPRRTEFTVRLPANSVPPGTYAPVAEVQDDTPPS
ncbi:MAG TPA: ATP-binding protein, partial [Arthrobacter sp.]|nr:ATP-binding protein [Arthrobacter sp.]